MIFININRIKIRLILFFVQIQLVYFKKDKWLKVNNLKIFTSFLKITKLCRLYFVILHELNNKNIWNIAKHFE